jgi:NAD(P)-dependent dehydrogenase (short-subunit alcohol dehydrogenase family)
MAIAVVTGASRGLGRALAGELAGRGWTLVLDGRDRDALAEAESAILPRRTPDASLVAIAGDVADADHRSALVRAALRLGGLDLVVNNASSLGATPLPRLADYPLGDLARVLDVNVVAPLALVQEALVALQRSARPAVLNITSDASVEAYEGWGGYGLSKAALDHMSAVLAVEEPSLLVWAVDPGDMRTQMHQDAFPGEDISDRPLPEEVVADLVALVEAGPPSGRYRLSDLRAARELAPGTEGS